MPLLVFYGGEVIRARTAHAAVAVRRVAAGFAIAILALPALISWKNEMAIASGCSAMVREQGAFACWGPRTNEFVEAAAWSGSHLPEGSVVLSRKPRIWYVQSGLPSETFPFTRDVNRFLAFADSVDARYVVLDYLDSAASVYVVEALMNRGGAFCALQKAADSTQMAEWGEPGGATTQVLGIMPPGDRPEAEYRETADGMVTVAMRRCPPDMLRPRPLPERSARTQQIPLLVGFR
jgi:hypothetical protein